MKSPIHQDNYYWCLKPFSTGTGLTIWIALDECEAINGGLTYLNGSQMTGILPHENSFAPGSSQTIKDPKTLLNKFEVVTPSLSPGDALIHDAHVAHYSEANVSGRSRRGMTLQYQSKTASVDNGRLADYEKKLKIQIDNRDLA